MHSEELITVTRDHNQIMQFESRQRMGKENKVQERKSEWPRVQRTDSHDPGIKQRCMLMV